MFNCFAWLSRIVIPNMVCRHVGYWKDSDGIEWDIGMMVDGERIEIEVR